MERLRVHLVIQAERSMAMVATAPLVRVGLLAEPGALPGRWGMAARVESGVPTPAPELAPAVRVVLVVLSTAMAVWAGRVVRARPPGLMVEMVAPVALPLAAWVMAAQVALVERARMVLTVRPLQSLEVPEQVVHRVVTVAMAARVALLPQRLAAAVPVVSAA